MISKEDAIKNMRVVYGSFTDREAGAMYDVVANLKPGSVAVEIGCYAGRSTCLIGQLQRDIGFDFYTIDPFVDGTPDVDKMDMRDYFIGNMRGFGFKYTLLADYSQNVAPQFNKPVDFLFIDGDHSTRGVMADRELWVPKVVAGGKILWHDFGSSWLEVRINVNRLIDEKSIGFNALVDSLVITTKL